MTAEQAQQPQQGHSISHGRTARSRYPGLGRAASDGRRPVGKSFIFLLGEPGSGKSTLLQSNPDAYIFNADLGGCVHAESQACMFPGVLPDGQACDENGQPIVLAWRHIEAKVRTLLDMAKANAPRPAVVGFDTISSMIRLLRAHVAELYRKDNFRDVDGRLGWERVFDTLIETFMALVNAGYGVVVVGHLSRKYIPLGENVNVEEWRPMVSEGLYARLNPLFDMVFPVFASWEDREVEVQQIRRAPGGQEQSYVRKVPKKVRIHRVVLDNPKLEGICKIRTVRPVSSIELDPAGPWSCLVGAIDAANAPAAGGGA